MNMQEIIAKKRDGFELSKEEIEFFVTGYTNKTIPDYQASALLMAIYFKGMTDEEMTNLTFSMLYSGEVIDLSGISGIKVDKHSTGGVGDKTTLVVGPLVAACNVKVAKMSGRGLGHTGGTLDKLESIEGFNIYLDKENFIEQVNDINISVIGQTSNLVPADKLLYALRDVTGTVKSIPLIASSIMSKKLASGADKIILDVKCGSGAFMKTVEEARTLAQKMVAIGKMLNRDTVAFITNMEQPLGDAIGNSLEVIEAIDTLKGEGPEEFTALCVELAAEMVYLAKEVSTLEEARKLVKSKIENGEGLAKLADLIKAQGGNEKFIYDTTMFEKSNNVEEIVSSSNGYVTELDALKIGEAAMLLGAGRKTKEDEIDMAVGIILNKKIGDKVSEGDVLAYVHTNTEDIKSSKDLILGAYNIQNVETEQQALIYEVVK